MQKRSPPLRNTLNFNALYTLPLGRNQRFVDLKIFLQKRLQMSFYTFHSSANLAI